MNSKLSAKRTLTIAVFVWLAIAPNLLGHHSYAGFDDGKTIIVTGKLVRLDWTRPHAYAYVEVVDAKASKTVTWSGELVSPTLLEQQGWTKEGALSLIGQTATLRGNPARNGMPEVVLTSLTTDKGAAMIPANTWRVENGVIFVNDMIPADNPFRSVLSEPAYRRPSSPGSWKLKVENGVIFAVKD